MSQLTREKAAMELLGRLRHGPHWSTLGVSKLSGEAADEAQSQYRIWFDSWVESDLIRLVPELRKQATKFCGHYSLKEME